MYVDIVPKRKSPPAILLRESIRQGEKIVKRTLANLSNLSIDQAQAIRRILKVEKREQVCLHSPLMPSSHRSNRRSFGYRKKSKCRKDRAIYFFNTIFELQDKCSVWRQEFQTKIYHPTDHFHDIDCSDQTMVAQRYSQGRNGYL